MKPIDYIYKNLHCFNLPIFKQILAESGEEVSESIYDYLMETTWNTNPTFLKQFGLDIVRTKEENKLTFTAKIYRIISESTSKQQYMGIIINDILSAEAGLYDVAEVNFKNYFINTGKYMNGSWTISWPTDSNISILELAAISVSSQEAVMGQMEQMISQGQVVIESDAIVTFKPYIEPPVNERTYIIDGVMHNSKGYIYVSKSRAKESIGSMPITVGNSDFTLGDFTYHEGIEYNQEEAIRIFNLVNEIPFQTMKEWSDKLGMYNITIPYQE